MKSFNLGRAVKKWRGQGKSFVEIGEVLNRTPEECVIALQKFFGHPITPTLNTSKDIKKLILLKRKIHLYGATGSGKSFALKQIADELQFQIFFSYATLEEELVKDWGDAPFMEENNIFVLEGDAYYWRKYGLIKRYIEDSKCPIIIVTNGKETPTKNVTKLLTQVKKYSPTKSDIATWIKNIDENYKNILIDDIFDRDWRKVVRNYLYGNKESFTLPKHERLQAKNVVYKLLKGDCRIEDFDNCIHPISFILNWLGWNLRNFYEGDRLTYNYNIISLVDSVKYSASKEYLRHILLQIMPSGRKGSLNFPPYKRYKNEKPKEELGYEISKFKRRNTPKPSKKKQEKTTTLSDFLLI